MNLINKKNMEENMNDMYGEEILCIDLIFFLEKMQELKSWIVFVIVGQECIVDLVLIVILVNGYVLIEGVLGVVKILFVCLIVCLIDVDFSCVQFIFDLMLSDVLGMIVFNMKINEFDFYWGFVFVNIILVDEINCVFVKMQFVFFEVMEECQVSIDGIIYWMGELYIILVIQNLVEQEGIYKLFEV